MFSLEETTAFTYSAKENELKFGPGHTSEEIEELPDTKFEQGSIYLDNWMLALTTADNTYYFNIFATLDHTLHPTEEDLMSDTCSTDSYSSESS